MSNIVKPPCDAGVIKAKRCSTSCSRITERWVLVATILGSSMAMIDGTVVNVALPVLQEALNANATQLQWVVESYALFLAALILVGGSLGDRFGRRLIYACGIALFALASGWCALSPDINQLIVARAFQGIGGALLVPGSLAILSASFGDYERGKAIGIWSGFTAITSALGPVLGGWLLENLSWRWIFFINVPLAIIILSVLFRYVPESRDREFTRLDHWGAMLITLGLGAAVFGLIESSILGLSHPLVISSIIIGLILLGAFVFVEANIYGPMMPLYLFKSRTFSGANLLTLLLYSALGGVLYFVPFNLIQVQGYSPTAAGAVFLPFILIMFFLSRWSGNLVNRYDAKLPLIVGPVIAAFGFILFALPGIGGSYWVTFFPAIVILGLGMSVSVAPLTTTVMGSVRKRKVGIASGVNNAVSRTAGLLAIAIFNIFVFNTFNYSLDRRLAKLNLSPQIQQALAKERINLAAAKVPENVSDGLKNAIEQAIALAYVDSFRLIMFIAAALALTSALVAFLMINQRQKPV
ncbi:drug resistance transporter, EmrB/QacA subfamily [Rivularia sp. PCC 7116]|uniref:MFS transporter n=1 Tax=Rivularia sp. PCC 7116 TaxID=373994 RepID=UPI00029F3C1E|nr:MFS transporter [Rivularia sp. PCC 7116]AFY58228.1 drug resistance transporter, EmrB/QacA subfamily [Rivularia sp. PCC 7116]